MKKQILNIALLAGLTVALVACKKTENLDREIVGLGGDTWSRGPIDEWITTNFTKPYNIDVKYRWDGSELAVDRTLVPVKAEKVIPIMDMVKRAWVNVYVEESGEEFIKRLAPKQYVLVGSPSYNPGGTITLGEAEGGNKITLFTVNDFDILNTSQVQRTLKTIHHEFGHILQQNVAISKDFQLITPAGYTADWNNVSLANAYAAGFISQYAQAAANEDFVEMLSIMVTQGKFGYQTTLKNIPTADALAKIRAKENNVLSYLKQSWNIDLPRLQNRTFKAINGFKEISPLNYFGFGKTYTSLAINPELAEQSAAFKTVYANTKTTLQAQGFILQDFLLTNTAANVFTLRVNFTNTAGTINYFGVITYTSTTDAQGKTTFVFASQDANATFIAPSLKPLTDYITLNQFKLDYYYSTDLKIAYLGFKKFDDATNFFIGTPGI